MDCLKRYGVKWRGEVKIESGVHQICFRYEGEGKFDLLEFELL